MYVKNISDLDRNSVFEAGGKRSSLGEMMKKGNNNERGGNSGGW